jgi:hypothetical protein
VLIGKKFQIKKYAQYMTIILLPFSIILSFVLPMPGGSAAGATAAASHLSSTKTNISKSMTKSGQQQRKLVAAGNNIYTVWTDDTPGPLGDIFFRRSTDDGSNFGSTINLSNDAGISINQQIAVAGANVYVVWADDTPGNSSIFLRKSTDGRNSFGSTINLSNNAGGGSFNPHMAVS